ncbi:hypothetical protein ES703_50595 [subsurface metagenome]
MGYIAGLVVKGNTVNQSGAIGIVETDLVAVLVEFEARMQTRGIINIIISPNQQVAVWVNGGFVGAVVGDLPRGIRSIL